MFTIITFIRKNPVLSYFALTFVISWGGFILAVGGPGGFPADPQRFEKLMPFVAWAMLAGPSLSGLLLTGLISGMTGFRELLSRLLKWRVNAGWYAFALLPAPILAGSLLFALSQNSLIFTADNKSALLLSGIAAGLLTVFEEIGWTGFATPRLRLRYSVLNTALIVGVLWGAWHLLQGLWISGTYCGELPVALFLTLSTLIGITQLTAYRVLLVWVYDCTESLLVVTLMHASLSASTIFIFRPLSTGVSFLTYTFLLTAALWVVVAAVALATRGQLSRQPLAGK